MTQCFFENELLFFVVIPIYNTEKSLPTCINSVLNQNYQNFRIILVDDGSPDAAGAVADEYALRDSRISVIHKENRGALSARCAGIDYIHTNFDEKNSYIMFLDSDDTYCPNALEVVRETILREKCDLVFFSLQRVSKENIIRPLEANPFVGVIKEKAELYKKVFFDLNYNPLCRKAIKTELIKSDDYSSFYHVKLGEDLLQSIQVYRDCKKAVFIADMLYNYMENPNSATTKIDYDSFKINPSQRVIVLQFLQDEAVFDEKSMMEYLRFCRSLMQAEVYKISNFDISYKRVKSFLIDLKNHKYYAFLLEDADCFILRCLKKGIFFPFLIPIRLRKWLSRTVKKVPLINKLLRTILKRN